ncbi:MAG TPA: sigma-70 family RNA polymerase sigma factor [Candidatus Sphingobacterium stercoripullorum]|nr:sigma-70 family RNA polymerase sigma factor [Candidatus Sphingobacterium stercoripullorum]
MKALSKKSDRILIKMFIGGDEMGLVELLNRYQARVYTAINLKVKDASLADDIFQEAFIKVIHNLKQGKYNEEGKFLPWVMRIAHNLVIDHFRKVQRSPSMINNDEFDVFEILELPQENVESTMVKNQRDMDLRKVIQKLPEEQKEVLIMRHFCEMSFKQIAEITGVSINTALGRMRYALQNLRKLIVDHNMIMQVD